MTSRHAALISGISAVLGLTGCELETEFWEDETSRSSHAATMSANQTLYANQSISEGSYKLTYQSDGNLVIYHNGTPAWASNTSGTSAGRTVMQGDGNLVVYDASDTPRWHSGTHGHSGAVAVLTSAGSLLICLDGTMLWRSHGSGTCPTTPSPECTYTGPSSTPSNSRDGNRQRLWNDYAGRAGQDPCALWSGFSRNAKLVFLTITHRLSLFKIVRPYMTSNSSACAADPPYYCAATAPQYETGDTMLDHIDALYAIAGRDPGGGCGGSDWNRVFVSMTRDLWIAMNVQSMGQPSLVNAGGWKESEDPAGPHYPFDNSNETNYGGPRGQTHFFYPKGFDSPDCFSWQPSATSQYKWNKAGGGDPYWMEMDQDYNLVHDSAPECFMNMISNNGDIGEGWQPNGCATSCTSYPMPFTSYTDPLVYDCNYYLSVYSDLRAAFGTNCNAAANHWLTYGIKEGRRASSQFSPQNYLARYPDLRAAFGYNSWSAIKHYIEFGRCEGRNGS